MSEASWIAAQTVGSKGWDGFPSTRLTYSKMTFH